MANFSRRNALKFLGTLPLVGMLPGCAKSDDPAPSPTPVQPPSPTPPIKPKTYPSAAQLANLQEFPPGYLAIVQGATSDTETLINVMTPKLKKYTYEASDASGKVLTVTKYETVMGPVFYYFDKLKITGMTPGVKYTLKVKDGKTLIDQRSFSSLDIKKKNPNFALVSCMADDYRFNAAIEPMWQKLQDQDCDFLVLSGDQVYVDSKEFVERVKGTDFDIWQRYVDVLRRLPLYHWLELKPILALWDDHDYGTNDGDRSFIGKSAADKVFHAVFGGQPIAGVFEQGPYGTCSQFSAFGQRFYMMDDRSFRQSNKDTNPKEAFGHWGQEQHEWLTKNLAADNTPAWIFNGNQFFNGVTLDFKEGFEQNSPVEFETFMKELSQIKAPVVFGSGDVHLGEIMTVAKDRLGYETYEFTSSSMHSYVGSGWANPLRMADAYTLEFNFMTINSKSDGAGLEIDMKCLGLAEKPYFAKKLSVRR